VLQILRESTGFVRLGASEDLPADAVWIDLLNPTAEESAFIESQRKVRIPSIEALSAIESSNRLAVDHDVVYLSIPAVAQGDTPDAHVSPTGFILTGGFLVTVRFAPLSTFDAVARQVEQDEALQNAPAIFVALLEAMVDRGADVLERLGREIDKVSKSVFRGDPTRPRQFVRSNNMLRHALTAVGTTGDRLALARDALLGVSRVAPFVLSLQEKWITPAIQAKLEAVNKDILSLNEYEDKLSNKIQFLLDAILGFISIQQNDIFKVLTIVTVVGIPPMLVAGIYGMNFKYMPELDWVAGYPFGLALIVLSAVIPIAWFKWRGWF
jgi:magnesium transporter